MATSLSSAPAARKHLLLALLGALVIVGACSDDPSKPGGTSQVPPDFLLRTSPENLVHNLVLAYNERSAAEFESLLADDFTFVLSEEDQENPGMPDGWPRDTEVAIHQSMFDTSYVQALTLRLTSGPLQWDPERGMYTMIVEVVDFYLHGATPRHPDDPKEYRVMHAQEQLWFRREGWTAPATDDSVWTVAKWTELYASKAQLPLDTTPVEAQSWGSVKYLYH